jgi:hypothetical protein
MDDESPPGPPVGDPDPSALALSGLGEAIVDRVRGLGATLVVTPTRLVVIRDGAHFRPRNGVRAWPFATLRDILLEQPRHGSGRIVLRVGPYPWQAVSLFVAVQEWPAAERVTAEIRTRAAQARRSGKGGTRSDRGSPATDPPERD